VSVAVFVEHLRGQMDVGIEVALSFQAVAGAAAMMLKRCSHRVTASFRQGCETISVASSEAASRCRDKDSSGSPEGVRDRNSATRSDRE
jgi:hypothetical protein